MYDFFTGFRAAILHRRLARLALNEHQVAIVVGAIGVLIAKRIALVAMAYDLWRNVLTKAIVEHKILSVKLRWNAFGF